MNCEVIGIRRGEVFASWYATVIDKADKNRAYYCVAYYSKEEKELKVNVLPSCTKGADPDVLVECQALTACLIEKYGEVKLNEKTSDWKLKCFRLFWKFKKNLFTR